MPEQFDVAARRHLDTADILEAEGRLDDAGYHYGLVGENAVKQSIVAVCGPLTKKMGLFVHFDTALKAAIEQSQDVLGVLASGRLGGGLAAEMSAGTFASRFDG